MEFLLLKWEQSSIDIICRAAITIGTDTTLDHLQISGVYLLPVFFNI